jgi:hypothetical protein
MCICLETFCILTDYCPVSSMSSTGNKNIFRYNFQQIGYTFNRLDDFDLKIENILFHEICTEWPKSCVFATKNV